jgi:hypothetical protein
MYFTALSIIFYQFFFSCNFYPLSHFLLIILFPVLVNYFPLMVKLGILPMYYDTISFSIFISWKISYVIIFSLELYLYYFSWLNCLYHFKIISKSIFQTIIISILIIILFWYYHYFINNVYTFIPENILIFFPRPAWMRVDCQPFPDFYVA